MITNLVIGRRIFKGLEGRGFFSETESNPFVFWRLLMFGVVGGAIGWLAWGSGPEIGRVAWVLLLPLAWGLAGSRRAAAALVLGYYLAGSRGLPGGVAVFFGSDAPWWSGVAFWASACGLLTVPFVVLWSSRAGTLSWRFVLAMGVSVVPPLAFIGWINPIAVAGILFPGMGWLGLVLTLGVMAALAVRSGKWLVLLSVLVLAANVVAFLRPVEVPAGWAGVDTHFSRLGSGGGDDPGQLLAAGRRLAWVKDFADAVPANSVRVLPETVLGPFGGMAENELLDVEARLAARGSRVLVGAEMAEQEEGGGRYLNSVIVLGAQADKGDGRRAVQGIPVPFSMWKPWANDGAAADVWGRGGRVAVKGKRVGVLVCYEQFLTLSMLQRMVSGVDVLVGVSNVWWAGSSQMPLVQRQTMGVWGRLFAVGVVGAANF